jgi:hypothetical protein
MSLNLFGPSREEVEILSADLIDRYGMEAYEEALHLSEISQSLSASRNSKLYRFAADEIKRSFETAWKKVLNRQRDPAVRA